MEGNQPAPKAAKSAKSAHVIDLRRGVAGAATATPPAARPRVRKLRPATARSVAKPEKPARKPAPVAVTSQAKTQSKAQSAKPAKPVKPAALPESSAPAASSSPAANATAAVASSAKTEFYERPTERRFWPAFWRFLLLLAILALIICVGVYVYLKFYSS